MKNNLSLLLKTMTPSEKQEVEDFAAFVLAYRHARRTQILTDDITTSELTNLVHQSGGFNWLKDKAEDVYSLKDGKAVKWPT